MTAERDGKSRRPAQPNLLASLPDERPGPGIDPAAIEEVLTAVQDLREQFAGLREAVSAEGPAPVTLEALEAWGDNLVTRVAEAAQTADASGDDAVVAHIGRMEEAAAKAAAAVQRNNAELNSIADQLAATVKRMESAVARMETDLATLRDNIGGESRRSEPTLEDIRTHTAGPRFGWWTVLACLIVFVLGMALESRIHILYRWL